MPRNGRGFCSYTVLEYESYLIAGKMTFKCNGNKRSLRCLRTDDEDASKERCENWAESICPSYKVVSWQETEIDNGVRTYDAYRLNFTCNE